MLQDVAPQGRAGRDLLAHWSDHVEEGLVDRHHQLLAPHNAPMVGGDPHPGHGIGLHVQLGMGVIGQAAPDLKAI